MIYFLVFAVWAVVTVFIHFIAQGVYTKNELPKSSQYLLSALWFLAVPLGFAFNFLDWFDDKYLSHKSLMYKLQKIKDVHAIQISDGNWDANDYMMGLANGLILAQAIIDGEEPKYKTTPVGGFKSRGATLDKAA